MRRPSGVSGALACSLSLFAIVLPLNSSTLVQEAHLPADVGHRLVRLGLPGSVAVGTVYLGAIGIGILTYVVSGVDSTSAWVLAGLIGVTLVVGGGFLLTVPVYPEGSGSGPSIAENYLDDQADSEHQ
jgi:hypothetical protein